jgi:hypothetical protein
MTLLLWRWIEEKEEEDHKRNLECGRTGTKKIDGRF